MSVTVHGCDLSLNHGAVVELVEVIREHGR